MQILEHEHAGLVRLPVEVRGQDVGDDPQRIDIGLFCGGEIGRKGSWIQLVQAIRRRVASAAQEYRPSVDGKAPASIRTLTS